MLRDHSLQREIDGIFLKVRKMYFSKRLSTLLSSRLLFSGLEARLARNNRAQVQP